MYIGPPTYVIYNKETTRCVQQLVSNRDYFTRHFDTERGAKMYLSRKVNAGKMVREEWGIAETQDFHANIEKKRTVKSLMNPNGPDIELPMNTHRCCDPSSNLDWSM